MNTYENYPHEEIPEQIFHNGLILSLIKGGGKNCTPKDLRKEARPRVPHIYNPYGDNHIFDVEAVIVEYSRFQLGEVIDNFGKPGVVTDIHAEYDAEEDGIVFEYWVDGEPMYYNCLLLL